MLGIGFWPTDYSPDYINANFTALLESAEIAMVQPEWTISSNPSLYKIIDSWLRRSKNAGLKTYIAVECFNGERKAILNHKGEKNVTFADNKFRSAYRDWIIKTVQEYKPHYLNIAVEVNMYLQTYPEETENFISLYKQIYKDVKKISPETKIFTSFQYEVLKGIFLGKKKDPQWHLLKRFDPLQDLIGISSYPKFGIAPYDPSKLPLDYYYDLKQYSSRPLFFAEVGWYSSESVSPSSSDKKQANFIRKMVQMTEPLDLEAFIWIGLRDLKDIPALGELKKTIPQFFSLGLQRTGGEGKEAWSVWKRLKTGEDIRIDNQRPSEPTNLKSVPLDRQPLVHLSFDSGVENFLGVGTTTALGVIKKRRQVREGTGALKWDYSIKTEPLPALLRQGISIENGTGLRFWLKTRNPTMIAVVLMDRDGTRYEHRLNIKNIDWHMYHIPFSDFSRAEGEGKLEPAKVEKLLFIDIYGFAGGKGKNTIWLDELRVE